MANDPLTYEDLLRIVEILKASELFSEFRLKVGDIEVELRRRAPAAPSTTDLPTVERAPGRLPSPALPATPAYAPPASPTTVSSDLPPAQPVSVAPHPEQASGDRWPPEFMAQLNR